MSPSGTVWKVRLTFCGQMITEVDVEIPLESVTVSVIRYRTLPLKSWPEVGIVKVPPVEPVTGRPGWTCPEWSRSNSQVNALGGRFRPPRRCRCREYEITSPPRNVDAVLWASGSSASAGVPTVIVNGAANVEVLPSETESRTV